MDKKNTKNYFVVAVAFIITIIATLYIAGWYQKYQTFKGMTPVLTNIIGEVKANELDNYLLENQDGLLFICKTADKECRSLEKDLKGVIAKRDIAKYLVYVNINDVNNKLFFDNFNKLYQDRKSLTTFPCVVLIRNGKVFDFVDRGNNKKLTIDLVDQFFDEYRIGK